MLEKESVQAALFLQMELYCGNNNLDTSNPPEKVDAKAQRMLDGITPGAINYVIELLSEISPLLFFANEGIFYTYTIWDPNYLDMYTTLSDHYKKEFAEKVLTREGSLITSIRHQTSQLWEWAVSAPGYAWLIKKVPAGLRTSQMNRTAVKNSGYVLEFVPKTEQIVLLEEAVLSAGFDIWKKCYKRDKGGLIIFDRIGSDYKWLDDILVRASAKMDLIALWKKCEQQIKTAANIALNNQAR